MKKHIVFLTGAGVSAESGLKTFRDSDGLWEGYDVHQVATPQGWETNMQLVLNFYNERRRDVAAAKPNAAHELIAALEAHYTVTVITQNIDDLHERGGSTNILHLHGQITQCRSVHNTTTYYPYTQDIAIGDTAPDGGQLRPHIVWFGEAVPMIEQAAHIMSTAHICVVVGTSLQVYPAAGLVDLAPHNCPIYVVDKHIPPMANTGIIKIEQPATAGMLTLYNMLTT